MCGLRIFTETSIKIRHETFGFRKYKEKDIRQCIYMT